MILFIMLYSINLIQLRRTRESRRGYPTLTGASKVNVNNEVFKITYVGTLL